MDLPAVVKTKIEQTSGKFGLEWAGRFPALLRAAQERWGLSHIEPFHNLSYHFVASARMAEREVVLKLGIPNEEFFVEASAVRAFAGACVALIDESRDPAAMLLERAIPGTALESIWDPAIDDECTEVIARAMTQIARPCLARGFPLLKNWAKEISTVDALAPFRTKAAACLRDLENEDEPVLLHGDLHHGNVLRHGSSYKIIDPKGVVGDRAFEVYALLHNPVRAPDKFLLDCFSSRIDIVSRNTGLSRQRLLKGAFLGSFISCGWSFQEGGFIPHRDLALTRRIGAAIC